MSDQEQPAVEFILTAGDKTEKGFKSAEQRAAKANKRIGAMQRKSADEGEKVARRTGRGLVRAFGEVEKATAKAFGNRSLVGGIASRMGGVTKASSALGDALGAVSAEGEGLTATVGTLGVAVAGTVGVMAAAAYGAFKLADGWAKGAASIGRTAEIIGVNTQKLQEFAAAAERVGVDKDMATGAVGGLSQTLNDARYGRNPQALAVLARLGVGLQKNSDGTVNVDAMMPAIADALARQNSSGRRTAARLLGIPEQALPAFTQGGRALSADMADAAKNAPLITDEDVTVGKRMQRRHVMAEQRAQRATISRAGRLAAEGLDSAETWAIGQFSGSVTQDFKPGARQIKEAGDKFERAARTVGQSGAARGGIGLTGDAIAAAQAAERKWGVPAAITLAQYQLESGGGRHMPPGSNNPFGIKARAGEPFVWASTSEQDASGHSHRTQAKFRVFSSLSEAFEEHAKLLATGRAYAAARRALPDTGAYADALTGHYATDRNYGAKLRAIMESEGLEAYDGGKRPPIPVEVTVHIAGHAPPGTRATVKAGSSPRPAVSHAYIPVHGG